MIRQLNPILYSIIITYLLTNFISSCSKNEEILLSDDIFVEVLSDLLIVEKVGVSESERHILAKAVFEKYKIDTTIFNKTRRYYKSDEKHWIIIYSRVKDLIKVKIDSIEADKKEAQRKEH